MGLGDNGNSAITGWQYVKKVGSGDFEATWNDLSSVVESGSDWPKTYTVSLTGLTNDTAYQFKVRAKNSHGDGTASPASNSLTPVDLTLSSVADQSWVKDIAKTVTLPAGSGGRTPLTYSVVGNLPSGLSFDGSTRALSGTATTVASATTYTYKVRDADGSEDTDAFTIEVTNATPTLSGTADQSWVKDIAKTVTLPEASGGDAPLTYSVVGDLPSGLSFNASTRQLSGTASAVASATTYTYKVRDANGDEATDLFTVAVTDATPTLPDVTAQSWVKDIAKTVTLPEASGGDAPLTYSVVGSLPSGLSFNASTRQLSGTASAEASATTYTYKARDANGNEATDAFTLEVTNATPTLSGTADQSWVKDIAKTVTLPEASGGDAPLTYSVVGDLPSGLSFNASTRQLSGTASAEASATTYTYKVRDANGDEDTDLFTVAVTDATPTLPDVTAQSWVKDIAKTVTLPEASGGDTPLTYSVVGSLPSGLSFNASTRQLSGTASTEASATTYTYKVEDANGDEDTDEFTIAVTNAEVTIPSVADQSWLKGVTVAVTLPAASSGDTPLTYSLAGSLPAGVSFNAATRVLSGTPSGTQTATTYTYKVEDKNGDEDTDEFTVAVTNAEVTIPSVADQSWLKGVTVAVTLPAASSGDTPLTYSLLGSLPVGVSFNAATRVLSGTPSGTQTATTYTYKVEDKNGDEDTDAFTLEVTNATPALSGTANQSWVKDIAKTVTLPASAAGDTPLTYSLLGNLPTGLSFDSSTRVLSGTATTVANATTYTYKVEDKNGDEDTEEFTLEVTNSTPALSSVSNKTWVKDVPKTVILPAASGGDAPLTYSVPGSLPTGLSFNSSSRTLSGTVSAAASPATYTYKVRDANGDEFTVEFTVEVLEQSGASDDQSEVDDSDPCALVPQDMAPTQPTLEGVPFLPAGPALASSNAELRVRLPSARTNALAPVLAWNFKLDHYKDESQLGTWTSVPEVWHMERAIAVTVLDSQAQPAASGVPAAAEDLARDLLFSRTEVPVARGSAASYAVRLATQPTADVTVTVAGPSESVGGLSISPAQLTFSASNWNHAQVVTVTAPAAEGDYQQATIQHAASGGGYGGVSGQVTAQEGDTSAKAITMSVNALEVGEDSTVTYSVHLAARPSSDVVLTIGRTGQAGLSVDVDPLAEGDQNSLTFTSADWNVVRPITVTAGPDENATDETAQLEHALSGDGFGKRIGGLENAKTYSACASIYLLSIQAVNRFGASAYSTAVQATPTTATPVAPVNLRAAPGAGEIALSWSDAVDDSISGYEYRYTTYAGTSSESRGLSAWQALEPTTQHVVQGMRFGVRYTFEVRALQGDQRGAVSRATAIPALADPVSRAPTGFVATWTATAEGQLRWDADPVAATYEYRHSGDDGATWTDWQDAVATCDAASCSATVTLNGTPEAYEFELRRRSKLNPDVARARTGTHPSAPKAPLLLAATPAGPAPVNQWQLTWTASTAGELVTGWQYRSVYLENPSGSLWTAWTDMQPATDEGGMSFTVMLGTEESKGQRMFQVRGTNSSGVGEPSNVR